MILPLLHILIILVHANTDSQPLLFGGHDGSTKLYSSDINPANQILACGKSDSRQLVNSLGDTVPVIIIVDD